MSEDPSPSWMDIANLWSTIALLQLKVEALEKGDEEKCLE